MITVTRILIALMTLIIPGLIQPTSSIGCPNGWTVNTLRSKCYKNYGDGKNYSNAVQTCNQDGGEIVMPKTGEEDNSLMTFMKVSGLTSTRAWIGLTDIGNRQWKWNDQEMLGTYDGWKSNQPNNYRNRQNCVIKADYGWNDKQCNDIFYTICQREIIYCEVATTDNTTQLLQYQSNYKYLLGESLTYTCEPPYYKLRHGNLARICMENGKWSGSVPVCEKVACRNETKNINSSGTLTGISGYTYNDNLTYSCEPPYYKLVGGDLLRTCTENEIWTGSEPVCKKITCSNETTYSNSSGTLVLISGYEYNDTLLYTCEPPYYKLEDGDLARICTENGTWSGKEPVCEQITCPIETTYSNSSGTLVSISGYEYNDTLSYTCEPPYYKLVDGDLARICTENGTWSGKEPVCERVTCPNEEEYFNMSGSLTEVSGYSYNDTLTYSCEPPYRKLMQGDLKRSCKQSGNWSGIEPVCKKCMCPCRKTKSKSVFTPAKLEEMVNEMKVNTKNISKAARRKTSAKDDRPSAKAVGCVGIIMLVIAGLVIIVPDLPCLYRDMKRGFCNIKSFLKRIRKKWNTQKQKHSRIGTDLKLA